jgi:3-oxoacyl-[acyl-carrier protein] reductase
MDLDLKGKRAIVTGGTRGIGRAIVETLVAEGAHVTFCARNRDEVAAATFGNAIVHGGVADIADAAGYTRWLNQAIEQLGGLDILICNASAVAEGASEAAWAACFNVDVMGAQRAADIAAPHLAASAKANGDASMLFISSVSAAETGGASAYGAMKAALIHLGKGLSKQLAAKGVRVNTLSPGTILFDGGFWNKAETERPDMFKYALARNPLGRMGRPQEIADVAVFLSSPRASFTTGANIVVDGAITSRVNF